MDVGISVSRVGGDAQIKAMKKVAGTLKISLAQYRAQAAFAMFASDLDAATRQQLTRGARLMELLKQPQYTPYEQEDQVVSIWAGTHGYLDDIPVEDVHEYEAGLLDYVRSNSTVPAAIRETGKLTDETETALKEAVAAFTQQFITSKGIETEQGEASAEHTTETINQPKRG